MGAVDERLAELGLVVPEVVPPVAAYVPAVLDGSRVYVSGQVPMVDGVLAESGHVGEGDGLVSPGARQGARGDLRAQRDRRHPVGRRSTSTGSSGWSRSSGFVASDPSFTGQPGVVNGASELFAAVFGDAGVHARSAVGVAALPLGAPVEVEVIVHVRD